MKGKLLIEPGFEAGSEYCYGCDYDFMEKYFYHYQIFNEDLEENNTHDSPKRCQQCLDAEVRDEV